MISAFLSFIKIMCYHISNTIYSLNMILLFLIDSFVFFRKLWTFVFHQLLQSEKLWNSLWPSGRRNWRPVSVFSFFFIYFISFPSVRETIETSFLYFWELVFDIFLSIILFVFKNCKIMYIGCDTLQFNGKYTKMIQENDIF